MSFNLKEKESRILIAKKVQTLNDMLESFYSDYVSGKGTTESNLDSSRINIDPEGVLESELDKVRTGTKEDVLEKKLDEEKSMFSKHRQNVSGNIPKLEEKRLSEKPVEKEKYQKANK